MWVVGIVFLIKIIIVRFCKWTRNLGTVNNRQTLTCYIGNIIGSCTFPSIYEDKIDKKYLFMPPIYLTETFFLSMCYILLTGPYMIKDIF